jgi:hypothetical protein
MSQLAPSVRDGLALSARSAVDRRGSLLDAPSRRAPPTRTPPRGGYARTKWKLKRRTSMSWVGCGFQST